MELVYSAVHETADGKKMLILHGDQFDIVVRNAGAGSPSWRLGIHYWALWTNTHFDGMTVFRLWLLVVLRLGKLKVKDAVNFISAISKTMFAQEAVKRGVDGVVCGHIHHATIKTIDGVKYINTGDFVRKLHGGRRARRRNL